MKIILAWPRPGVGDAGETVDVDVDVARILIADGMARLPDSVASLSGDDVETVAALEGVDLSGLTKVTDKRAAIEAAREHKEG